MLQRLGEIETAKECSESIPTKNLSIRVASAVIYPCYMDFSNPAIDIQNARNCHGLTSLKMDFMRNHRFCLGIATFTFFIQDKIVVTGETAKIFMYRPKQIGLANVFVSPVKNDIEFKRSSM